MLPEGIEANSLKHSLERATERYGVQVNPRALAEAIEAGIAEYKGAGYGANRKIYEVPVQIADEDEIIWVRVVYQIPSSPRFAFGKIITVLPPAASVSNDSNQRGTLERAAHKGRYRGGRWVKWRAPKRKNRDDRFSENDF